MAKSNYPTERLLADIVFEQGLKREGLVAECAFPGILVPSCDYKWADWTDTADFNGRMDNMKAVEDLIGCYSAPKRINPSSFKYVNGTTQEHALEMVLKDCCGPNFCGPVTIDVDGAKTMELTDLLLLQHELRAIAKITDESAYTDAEAALPADETAEGTMFNLSMDNLLDPAFDLFGYFQDIQSDNDLTGARNVLITKLSLFNKILRHPSFKPGGCAIPVMAAQEELASLLGLQKICIADTVINTALPNQPYSLTNNFGEYFWMAKTVKLQRTDAPVRGFGFGAYTKDVTSRIKFDEDLGAEGGDVQIVYHDITPTVVDYKAATLIKVTPSAG